jgi:hypothetical protein
VNARADLYACGVVLYEMLTGERPAGTDVPSDLDKSVPRHLDEIFRRSYARLEKRFTSADEFLAALGSGATSIPVHLPRILPGEGPIPGTTQRCPSCRKEVDAQDQFCMHCGVQLVATVRRCPKCGAYPDLTDQYCIFCGETLSPQLSGATG